LFFFARRFSSAIASSCLRAWAGSTSGPSSRGFLFVVVGVGVGAVAVVPSAGSDLIFFAPFFPPAPVAVSSSSARSPQSILCSTLKNLATRFSASTSKPLGSYSSSSPPPPPAFRFFPPEVATAAAAASCAFAFVPAAFPAATAAPRKYALSSRSVSVLRFTSSGSRRSSKTTTTSPSSSSPPPPPIEHNPAAPPASSCAAAASAALLASVTG